MEINNEIAVTPIVNTPHRSTETKNLFAALAKAQGEMTAAGLNNDNPFFKSKYADLTEIVRASRPALVKNGLSVIQQILVDPEGLHVLHTILAHSSGEYIESCMKINPLKPDVQALGSYITYIKRYSYASLVGVVTDDDDDGEYAMKEYRQNPATPVNYSKNTYITREQLDILENELLDIPETKSKLLNSLQITSLEYMPKIKFSSSLDRVREIKAQLRKNN